ncbi:hypothetical protein CPHO_05335 [Corynebacterium phocae]|uniref:Bacterial bifunctional deaminase-reductase C-terminal domain-containing protein n=1 Tax=Corynebacterium phocae TaxID=161895 RepID=A0A1L7D2P2_9CORY|nr:pyrimidine reductase family protein [Corynebacterium phocae]APT92409.1 hypothetical protein CPHO_05335 [Corynebacterium phocae]KAA8725005.1 pyrimidine reductase family protein [Corynebacterium phocae]
MKTHSSPTPELLLGPKSGPGIRAIMVSSLTGSAAMSGNSQELGNQADTGLLMALRQWADVVLVGSATVKKENYGGVQPTPARPVPPPIAVATRSLDFNVNSRFFRDCTTPPLFLCPEKSLSREDIRSRAKAIEKAGGKVLTAGTGTIEDYLRVLQTHGMTRVSCEGGPGILGQCIRADRLDKLYLTLSPHLGSGVELPLSYDAEKPVYRRMVLESVIPDVDGTVFLRYSRTAGE